VSMPLRARLGRVGARLGPGTGGFLAWWGRSLAAWLPRRWRALFGLDRGRLLLAPEVASQDDGSGAHALQLRLQEGDELRDVGSLPLLDPHLPEVPVDPGLGLAGDPADDPLAPLLAPALADLPRWLLLPAAAGLRRRLVLPAAAGDRLREVLGFEIDRQTPFAADEVAFDARLLGRRGDSQIDVELVAVPLAALRARRTALGPLSATLAGIDIAGADGAPLGVNLLPAAERRQVADPWRGWNLALGVVALVALSAALWQLLDNRRDAADAFEQALAPRAEQARRVAMQRQQLQAIVEGQAYLDRTRAARPPTVAVLDELARRLPDSTYLEKVSIEGERLLIIGLSGEASSLVRRLEGADSWHAPALTGALQPDPRSGRDRFTLTAELGRRAPAPAPATEAAGGAAR
jgi:general secretion pathway protein L